MLKIRETEKKKIQKFEFKKKKAYRLKFCYIETLIHFISISDVKVIDNLVLGEI